MLARLTIHLAKCPTQPLWFEKFAIGCRLQMNEIIKADRTISIKEMLILIDIAEDMAKGAVAHKERRKWILLGVFVAIAYVGSFCVH
eukprot:5763684-Ditylum_brightwellii.AAC.1